MYFFNWLKVTLRIFEVDIKNQQIILYCVPFRFVIVFKVFKVLKVFILHKLRSKSRTHLKVISKKVPKVNIQTTLVDRLFNEDDTKHNVKLGETVYDIDMVLKIESLIDDLVKNNDKQ